MNSEWHLQRGEANSKHVLWNNLSTAIWKCCREFNSPVEATAELQVQTLQLVVNNKLGEKPEVCKAFVSSFLLISLEFVLSASQHTNHIFHSDCTVRGHILTMAGWKPSPVTSATGSNPDGLKLPKPPLFLQFLYNPRHTACVFSRHLLRKPPKKGGK